MLKVFKNILFDKKIKRNFKENIDIEYGIIKGNNTIVLIKVGQDGDIFGYDKKYLKMARTLNKEYGYTVIVSSNPFDGTNHLDNAMEVIEEYVHKNKFDDYKIYYMGHSNGARVGMCFGHLYPKIERMILTNGPLHVNLHKSKDGLKKCKNKKIYLVYGEKDPSALYTELLYSLLSDDINLEIIDGADHHFSDMLDKFIELSIKYFK